MSVQVNVATVETPLVSKDQVLGDWVFELLDGGGVVVDTKKNSAPNMLFDPVPGSYTVKAHREDNTGALFGEVKVSDVFQVLPPPMGESAGVVTVVLQ